MSYNVLVVDDSGIIRAIVKKSIAMSGLDTGEMYEAANGHEALRVLREMWVDIVFSDIHMPEMTGLELVERMSEDDVLRNVPVVIVSSDRSQVHMDELRHRGVRAFIHKPFVPENFRDVVTELLGASGGAAR